ncbi:hypothetical protein DFJ77DRAFT_468153 [Powellomyces hirtus]|nr:hypothetical protein DFJ77DRAFT_468153 [Powellomyces hirtus]
MSRPMPRHKTDYCREQKPQESLERGQHTHNSSNSAGTQHGTVLDSTVGVSSTSRSGGSGGLGRSGASRGTNRGWETGDDGHAASGGGDSDGAADGSRGDGSGNGDDGGTDHGGRGRGDGGVPTGGAFDGAGAEIGLEFAEEGNVGGGGASYVRGAPDKVVFVHVLGANAGTVREGVAGSADASVSVLEALLGTLGHHTNAGTIRGSDGEQGNRGARGLGCGLGQDRHGSGQEEGSSDVVGEHYGA